LLFFFWVFVFCVFFGVGSAPRSKPRPAAPGRAGAATAGGRCVRRGARRSQHAGVQPKVVRQGGQQTNRPRRKTLRSAGSAGSTSRSMNQRQHRMAGKMGLHVDRVVRGSFLAARKPGSKLSPQFQVSHGEPRCLAVHSARSATRPEQPGKPGTSAPQDSKARPLTNPGRPRGAASAATEHSEARSAGPTAGRRHRRSRSNAAYPHFKPPGHATPAPNNPTP